MTDVRGAERLQDRWDDRKAAGMSEPELLLYRSNLLGSDLRITNFGGGNTSAKVRQKDPLTGKDDDRALGEGLGRRPRVDEAATASRRSTSTSSSR